MRINSSDNKKCGIYLIKNLINGKVYIGKSINIARRLRSHKSSLTIRKSKEENSHFIASWHKYGENNFSYIVLEECSIESLKERELHWIKMYNSTDSNIGYNKRLDSEGGMIPHIETRKKLSEAQKKRFFDPKEREKLGKKTKKFWKDNPDAKDEMARNVKLVKQKKYKFIKLSENEEVIKIYDSVEQIIEENKDYKWQNIYSVCNGYKKRIYGYKWRKELKI